MNWETLLSTKRYKQESATGNTIDRSAFEKDFDRIVFSTAFRKLQDKTQVIPFPITDFVHSRLTHSLEVSCVGRSLGKIVGQHIISNNPILFEKGYDSSAIGALVAAASLAHDIGNPPFGHSGENAFRSFFESSKGLRFKSMLSESQWHDLARYEGNANGFRILTNLNQSGGLRLTAATLASFTKYPTDSTPKHLNDIQLKKNGFFTAEKEQFELVANTVGLVKVNNQYARHPLAFLMEAADDICYSIIDFEDGIRLGLVDIEQAYILFEKLLGNQLYLNKLKQINSIEEQAGLMRALTINKLTNEIASIFIQHENEILAGTFNKNLIKCSESIDIVNQIKSISINKVYQSNKVLMIEATGFEVIEGLLDIFTSATTDQTNSFRAQKILQLLPKQYLNHETGKPYVDVYSNILSVCDYISSLSDSQAISLFRKLKGIEIPT